ncbi:hypothetical protein HKCCE3408_14645 [Rhodobacterales bacterium HKCCE3408]|nr:hypothetical protein [Rhodobacterales bacterium HKCCE3408]
MTTTATILRIGPFAGAAPGQRFLYVPVLREARLDDLVFADTDRAGILELADRLPDHNFACDPEMDIAGLAHCTRLDELDPDNAELRADLATAFGEDDAFPASDSMALRRMVFEASRSFNTSFSPIRLVKGGVADIRLKGRIGDRAVDETATMSGREVDDETLAYRLDYSGGSVELTFEALPEESHLLSPYAYAYGTDLFPRILQPGDPDDVADLGLVYALFGAALDAMSEIEPSETEHAERTQPAEGIDLEVEVTFR